ncbi:MAG: HEPN domain-containing protein [Ilumatobacteraceae bacterium]
MTEPADPSAATALSWIAKATDDLTIAELILDSDVGVEWAACFHAQQAAEKAVKAVLVCLGTDFPKSHRLDRLAALLPASCDPGFDIAALTELAPWAVAGRYPEDIENPTEAEATGLVELAQHIVRSAKDFIAST